MDGSPDGAVTNVPMVDCGLGDSPCTGASGAICLISRGNISFSDKVLACQNSGGLAAIIYNNEPGMLYGTLNGVVTSIPSVGISDADGAAILEAVNAGTTTGSVELGVGNYDSYNGTSMATPHVAGVAALVWSHAPDAGAVAIRQALQATAIDLGAAGRDNSFGHGLVQAAAAVDALTGGGGGGGGGGGSGNTAPTASFTFQCTDLACSFDASGSSDSDGSISSYAWSFGDGSSASGVTANHSYSADGTYTVTLTVTDNAGATGTASENVNVSAPSAGGITLSASGYKVKGVQTADLTWSGAGSANVDIRRDGVTIMTTPDDGAYTDNIGNKGGGSYTYQVCEAGTSTCSGTVTVTF
jgi:PKD repeat protein